MTTSAPRSRAADSDAARSSGSAAGRDPTAGGDRRVRRILAWIIDLLPVAALFLALWVAGSDVLESRAGACDPAPAPDCNVLEQTDRLDEAGNVVIEFTLVDGRVIDSDHTTFEFFGTVYIADPPTLSSYLVTFAYVLLVFVGVQGTTGWTPGKLVTGLRLADESRRTPGVGRALLRWALPDGALGVVGVVAAVVGAVWPMRLFALFGALGIVRFLGELVPAAAGPFGDRRIGVRVIARDDFIGGRPDHGGDVTTDSPTDGTTDGPADDAAPVAAGDEKPPATGLIDQVPIGPTTTGQHDVGPAPGLAGDAPDPAERTVTAPAAGDEEPAEPAPVEPAPVEKAPDTKPVDPVEPVAVTDDAEPAATGTDIAAAVGGADGAEPVEPGTAAAAPVTAPAAEPVAAQPIPATTPVDPQTPDAAADEPAPEQPPAAEPEPEPVVVAPSAGAGPATLAPADGDRLTSVEPAPATAAAAATDPQVTAPAAGPAAITEDEDEDTTFTELAAAMTGPTPETAGTTPDVPAGRAGGDDSAADVTAPPDGEESGRERIDTESPAPAAAVTTTEDRTAVVTAAAVNPATADNPYKPQWDNARRAYICWEPVSSEWLQWDDTAKAWGPISR